ncbi:cupin domain-containing protein [Bacillus sp. FJAT-49682]|uniref:glucose-6-phosphate isomerase n=2 Tax=Lederbergia citrea TaxID=2833581 RepID=A0A942UM04_9BACI|nr:cupin domain-containing protein [Lederbergia citrea]
MTTHFKPFNTLFLESQSILEPKGKVITRRLSDMAELYQDQKSAQSLMDENPLVYEVFNVEVPESIEHIQHCITVLYPGKVGEEFFMTKGHYHEILNRAEIYFCFKGEGKLVMQTQDGDYEELDMKPGTISYVPPNWAHRTVNTGEEPFVFFAAYPGDAGHNYGDIEKIGFRKVIVNESGEVKTVDNPRYQLS